LLDNEKKLLYAIYRVEEGENMIYPSIDKLLNNVGSKFLLVNIISKRVKEMQETEYYQLNEYKSHKNIGKALEEVAKGLINIKEK
jgi:DNA-directed RNA polymerase subunit omega